MCIDVTVKIAWDIFRILANNCHIVNNVAMHIDTHDYIRDNCIVFESFTASIVDLMVANIRLLAPLSVEALLVMKGILLALYLCWWTINPRGYHPPRSQCFDTDMVY
jgi:hypothetical protein